MPTTYTLIASNTLSSSATSVAFSSIPGDYTDLVLKGSVRYINSSNSYPVAMLLNGSTSAIYSRRLLMGQGSAGISNSQSSNDNELQLGEMNGALSTANTFTNLEIYISNYTSSSPKSFSSFLAQEDNAASYAFLSLQANRANLTSAVTSLTFRAPTAYGSLSFAANSSFFLYGIKNS